MEFGLGLMNYPGCWDDVAFAEQHGFSTAGFVDTPVLAGDPYACMALAAQATSKIRIGTMITMPGLRDPAETASALSTINAIAPGRVFFGAGTGYTGRLALGLKRQVPSARLRNYARDVRDLYNGCEVLHRLDKDHERVVRMANAEFLQNNQDHPIPVYIAADGPKAIGVAGEVGDGIITALRYASAWDNSPEVFRQSLALMKETAADSGRELDDPYTVWAPTICVLKPGESAVSPRALATSGPLAMLPFHSYACDEDLASQWPPAFRDRLEIYEKEVLSRFDVPRDRLYQEVHVGHLTRLLDGEAAVLTEEIMRMTTLTGTAEEIASHLNLMEREGLKNLTVWAPPSRSREVVSNIAGQIVPLLDSTVPAGQSSAGSVR